MSGPMLEIRNLCKAFPIRNAFGRRIGEVRAVDNVSFAIEKGKVYGLAGKAARANRPSPGWSWDWSGPTAAIS